MDRETVPAEKYSVAYLIPGKSGIAVERNRIKRWLREDFNFFQKRLNISGLFAVKFKGIIKEVKHPEIKDELEKLFEAINND